MVRMQDKVLNEIDELAKAYALEAVISYGATNTGALYIMDRLDSVLIIRFNFQTSYFSMQVYNERDVLLEHMSNGYLEYKNSSELKHFLARFDHYLREYDMEKEEIV